MLNSKKTLETRYVIFFIFRFFIIVLAGVWIAGSLVITFLDKRIGPSYSEGISSLSQLQTLLPPLLFITAFIQALALCIIVMFLALLWSQAIAGPLVRFRRHLKDIVQGKSMKDPVVFRNADQLHGLALAFSEMIISRRDNCAKALGLLVEAQRTLDECKALEKQEKGDSQEFNLRLKELKAIYVKVKDIYIAKASG